jgi:hypothetical protein
MIMIPSTGKLNIKSTHKNEEKFKNDMNSETLLLSIFPWVFHAA